MRFQASEMKTMLVVTALIALLGAGCIDSVVSDPSAPPDGAPGSVDESNAPGRVPSAVDDDAEAGEGGDSAADASADDGGGSVTANETGSAVGVAAACEATDGVPIGTDDNAADVMRSREPGTAYMVEAGVHSGNFDVEPRSGDTFCGEPGAVLDGAGRLESAFSGEATNVTLDSLTVQNYDDGWQGGAISPDPRAAGWVVRNVTATNNHWAGLLAADGMKILGGSYIENGQLGIGGNAATGILLDGLDDDPATYDGPELARNKRLRVECGWEGGGMKWDRGSVTIRNAHVHDNACKGLWADINARDALIEHNLIENNGQEGILYEISQDAVIRNNEINENSLEDVSSWYWSGGITVASSFNVQIYDNRLSGNFNGITGTQQDRFDSTPPAHLLDHLDVRDNLICASVGPHPTGVAADNGADLDERDIIFANNTIRDGTCD